MSQQSSSGAPQPAANATAAAKTADADATAVNIATRADAMAANATAAAKTATENVTASDGTALNATAASSAEENRTNACLALDAAAVAATLPHADPFLFVSSAQIETGVARGSYTITGKEDFLRGHFKGRPVFPASIMLEALGQLGVLYLLTANDPDLAAPVDPERIFFTSCDGVRCARVTTPGETLEMTIRPKRLRHPAAAFEGSISVKGERTIFAEKISLVFDYRQG